jgi:hypothetical protein
MPDYMHIRRSQFSPIYRRLILQGSCTEILLKILPRTAKSHVLKRA